MSIVKILLALISIATIVGPIGYVLLMYQNNLPGLVVPPEINDIINNFSNGNNHNNGNGSQNGNNGDNSNLGLISPEYVGTHVDTEAKTFETTLNITNNFGYDLTLNSISATVIDSETNQTLANINIDEPIVLSVGEASQVTISGGWTQAVENLIASGATSVNVDLSNISINVNGIIMQLNGVESIGDIPLSDIPFS